MISAEQNDRITRTGPGTPAGALLRRYWQPVALVEELAGDRPLRPVRVLGQDLVLFRDDHGRLGLVDRDDDDCVVLKEKLEKIAAAASLKTKTAVGAGRKFQVVNRIAIEELEAWFFGDWEAVRNAYPRVPVGIPEKAVYRDPDSIAGGTWEALERVLKNAGYFTTGLRKIELARSVARHMDPRRNRSRSFRALVEAIDSVLA